MPMTPEDRITQLVSGATADDFTQLEPLEKADYELWRKHLRSEDGRKHPKGAGSFEFLSHGARVLAASAFAGRAWSLTVRREGKETPQPRARGKIPKGDWTPSDGIGIDKVPRNAPLDEALKFIHLFSFQEITDLLALELKIGGQSTHQKGFLLVTGRTGSGKSDIARGLAERILQHEVEHGGSRKPHLVTLEDPIEKDFCKLDKYVQLQKDGENLIDYTPRQLGKDCASFEEATRAALRQTPTVFYAGEVRDKKQMQTALDFAATGHLIVATAHAGSLVEAVSKILDSVGARTPASRAEWAARIRGVVHLERFEAEVTSGGGCYVCRGVVPALYKRTTSGVQSLVADGKSSVLPGRDRKTSHSLGHAYFAEELGRRATDAVPDAIRDAAVLGAGSSKLFQASMVLWLVLRGYVRGFKGGMEEKSVLQAAIKRDLYAQ